MLSPAFTLLFWAIAAGLVLGVGVSLGMFVKRARTGTVLAWLACVSSGQLAISMQLAFAHRCAVALSDVARMLGVGAMFALTAAALTLSLLKNGRERLRIARLAPWLAAALVVLFVTYVSWYLLQVCWPRDLEQLDYGLSQNGSTL